MIEFEVPRMIGFEVVWVKKTDRFEMDEFVNCVG